MKGENNRVTPTSGMILLYVKMLRLSDLLLRQAYNNSTAIKYADISLSYSDWNKRSIKIAQNIKSKTSSDSLNVAIFLPNSINYAIAYFAVQFSDKVMVPIGIHAKEPEIINTLKYCEIDLIISDSEHVKLLNGILSSYAYRIFIFNIDSDDTISLNPNKEPISKTDYIQQNLSEDDVAIMLHTSGTTNNLKRVMLTHSNLINNVESNIQSLKLNKDDKVLISMPMYFGYCNTAQFLTHLYLGASMVILNGLFLPKLFFQTVQNERITNFTGVPSMLLMLLEYRYIDKYDISSLNYICFGGGKMPVEQLQNLLRTFKTVSFVQTYGQTEASPRITALLPEDALRKIGSVGLPIPNVIVKIISESGNASVSGEIGEVAIQGKNVMKGYYKQDEITKKTIVDNWLHTNDLGYFDSEGYLYLTGRKTNMIISGGINIYPEEIEEILMNHPNIKEVCVISEEHALLGEVPIAKIVLKDSAVTDNYRDFCTDKLAYYKMPIRFDVVCQLDKTYNGKIIRNRSED